MALSATQLKAEILDALEADEEIPFTRTEMVEATWGVVARVLVEHIQDNSDVVGVVVDPNTGTQTQDGTVE